MTMPTAVNSPQHQVVVGIAEYVVSNDSTAILTTYSLGSCLGISVFDPAVRAGGLLHIMLADSAMDPAKGIAHPAMFVDTGVAALLRAIQPLNCDAKRMIFCVAGGSQIMDATGFFSIGIKNLEALKKLFTQQGLRISAEHVGGMVNRTMSLNLATGEVRLKVSGQKTETVLCKSLTAT